MQGFYKFQQIKTLFQIMNITEDLLCAHTSKKHYKGYEEKLLAK